MASKMAKRRPKPMIHPKLDLAKLYIRLKSTYKAHRIMKEAVAWTLRRAPNTTVQKQCFTGSEADASLTRILTLRLTN